MPYLVKKDLAFLNIKLLSIRMAGVLFSMLASFINIRFFITLEQNIASTYFSVLGMATFLQLVQMGIGRPSYSYIRSRIANKTIDEIVINKLLYISSIQIITAVALYPACIYLWVAKESLGNYSVVLAIIFFSIAVGLINASGFHRDLAYAINEEYKFEKLDAVRKFSFFLCSLSIALDYGIIKSAISAVLLTLPTLVYMHRCIKQFGLSIQRNEIKKVASFRISEILPKSCLYLLYTISELLLYSFPILYFTFTKQYAENAYYTVWQKIFMVTVLLMQLNTNSNINGLVDRYYTGNFKKARSELRRVFQIGIYMALICLFFMFLLSRYIGGILNASYILEDQMFFISLAVWALGNTVQHVHGTFTISCGDGFKLALTTSLVSGVAVSGTLIFSQLFFKNPGLSLLFAGCSYMICALVLKKNTERLLKA